MRIVRTATAHIAAPLVTLAIALAGCAGASDVPTDADSALQGSVSERELAIRRMEEAFRDDRPDLGFVLGNAYRLGRDAPIDPERAETFYAGFSDFFLNEEWPNLEGLYMGQLAIVVGYGWGTEPADPELGEEMLEMAAGLGDPTAVNALAQWHLDRGNLPEAALALETSAENGWIASWVRLGTLAQRNSEIAALFGAPDQLFLRAELALQQQIAQDGDPDGVAAALLAELHGRGLLPSASEELAATYAAEAVDKGNAAFLLDLAADAEASGDAGLAATYYLQAYEGEAWAAAGPLLDLYGQGQSVLIDRADLAEYRRQYCLYLESQARFGSEDERIAASAELAGWPETPAASPAASDAE